MRQVGAVLAALLVAASTAFAQHSGAPTGEPRKQCLSDADRAVIAQLKAMNRPTRSDDPVPPFNPDYFVGTWDMEYDAPETPLAPEGVHTGTLTFTHVDGCYYEGELKAKGPKGVPYTSRIQMMYDPAANT